MNIATKNSVVPAVVDKIIADRGLKKGAVARKAGIPEQAFSDMLNGRRLIRASDLLNISQALDCSLNDLFDYPSAPQRSEP